MSDETHDDHGHDEHEHQVHFHGIAIPVGDLRREIEDHHDRCDLEAMSLQARTWALFDSLDRENLYTLRQLFGLDNESSMANYFEGQLVSMLRAMGVDPATGLTMEEALKQRQARRPSPDVS